MSEITAVASAMQKHQRQIAARTAVTMGSSSGFTRVVQSMEHHQRRLAQHAAATMGSSSPFTRAVHAMEQHQRRMADRLAANVASSGGFTSVVKALDERQRRIANQAAAAATGVEGFARTIDAVTAAHQAQATATLKHLAAVVAPLQQAAERFAGELARSVDMFAVALQHAAEVAADRAARTARSARRLWWSITGRDEGSNGAAWAHLRDGVPLAAAPPGSDALDLPRRNAPLQPILRHGPPQRGLFCTTTYQSDASESTAIAC